MKKLLVALLALLMLAGCAQDCPECEVCAPAAKTVADLPVARDTTKSYKDKDGKDVACTIDDYSVDCSSIDSSNLKDYLDIDGVVYIDARDYGDFAKKHLRNFECIPYFALIFNAEANGEDLPQLFKGSVAEPVAVYEESVDVLTDLIPTDKTVFLMCQSGGRIKQLMNLMAATKEYDMSKVYNIGGMNQYTEDKGWTDATVSEYISVTATYAFTDLTVVK